MNALRSRNEQSRVPGWKIFKGNWWVRVEQTVILYPVYGYISSVCVRRPTSNGLMAWSSIRLSAAELNAPIRNEWPLYEVCGKPATLSACRRFADERRPYSRVYWEIRNNGDVGLAACIKYIQRDCIADIKPSENTYIHNFDLTPRRKGSVLKVLSCTITWTLYIKMSPRYNWVVGLNELK